MAAIADIIATISRIEKNQRHVCDAELKIFSKALDVSMDWLCGDGDDLNL